MDEFGTEVEEAHLKVITGIRPYARYQRARPQVERNLPELHVERQQYMYSLYMYYRGGTAVQGYTVAVPVGSRPGC